MKISTKAGDVSIPDDAVSFPAAAHWPEYQQQTIDSIVRLVYAQNVVKKNNFDGACLDWLAANARNRDMNLPLLPKPVAAPRITVHSIRDLAGNAFVWQENGPPLGVCPDLPALPPSMPPMPEPDHIRNVPPGDTMPVGFVMTTPDGARWQKQSSPTPFGTAYFYTRVA